MEEGTSEQERTDLGRLRLGREAQLLQTQLYNGVSTSVGETTWPQRTEVDARQTILLGNLLCAQMLLDCIARVSCLISSTQERWAHQ